MKIGSSHELPGADSVGRGTRTAATPAPLTVAPSTEQVDVSAAGVELARAGGGDFDQAKVDAIRKAISEGRFTVNAGAIADQLISDAAALLSSRAPS
jgi:negative regulator of flagellin synthesis FlgM